MQNLAKRTRKNSSMASSNPFYIHVAIFMKFASVWPTLTFSVLIFFISYVGPYHNFLCKIRLNSHDKSLNKFWALSWYSITGDKYLKSYWLILNRAHSTNDFSFTRSCVPYHKQVINYKTYTGWVHCVSLTSLHYQHGMHGCYVIPSNKLLSPGWSAVGCPSCSKYQTLSGYSMLRRTIKSDQHPLV